MYKLPDLLFDFTKIVYNHKILANSNLEWFFACDAVKARLAFETPFQCIDLTNCAVAQEARTDLSPSYFLIDYD